MEHFLIFLLIFASVFVCALLGMYARTRLPNHHLDEDSASSIKLASPSSTASPRCPTTIG